MHQSIMLSLLTILLCSLFCQIGSSMILTGFDSNFTLIANSVTTCDNREICYNEYNMIMKTFNVHYVCVTFEENNCWLGNLISDNILFQSFGVTLSPFEESYKILPQTIYQCDSFAKSFVIQCMNYDKYQETKAFCISPLYRSGGITGDNASR